MKAAFKLFLYNSNIPDVLVLVSGTLCYEILDFILAFCLTGFSGTALAEEGGTVFTIYY